VTGGAHGGGKVELDVNRLYGQQLRIIGGTSGPREFADRAWEAARAGQLHPIIGATLPLSDVAEAHRIAESQGVVGKVMLSV
jgi:NADPH:quinone reductase-like Zn-dependent oxidoreductase